MTAKPKSKSSWRKFNPDWLKSKPYTGRQLPERPKKSYGKV